jgi:serine/threonine protein kinase
MADVWLARSRAQGRFIRLVALKILRAETVTDPRARVRFLREAEIAASIHHANVVDVTDVGEESGFLFQAMTLVEGDSLAGLLRADEPLSLGATLSIVVDALRGLHAAHESVDSSGKPRLVVHRDVSPQNILVGRDGLARISDFGIARVLSEDDESTASREGKYAYFAPEQVRREPIDRRTDVFALGVVLWEALTRARLFKSTDAIATLEAVCHLEIPDPRTHAPDVPDGLAFVVMKALAREPGQRYSTAAEMADALIAAGDEVSISPARADVVAVVEKVAGDRVRRLSSEAMAPPSSVAETLDATIVEVAPPVKRRRRLVAGVAVAFAVVAGGVAIGWARRQGDERAAVREEPVPAVAITTAPPALPVPPAPAEGSASSPTPRHAPPSNKRRSSASGAPQKPRPPFPDNPFKAP